MMARQATTARRELRPRSKDGLAKTSIGALVGVDYATVPGRISEAQKAFPANPAGKKKSSMQKTSPSPKKAPEKKKKTTPKANSRKASTSRSGKSPKPAEITRPERSKSPPKQTSAAKSKPPNKRTWFVWPPYTRVTDIPAEHQKSYKDLIAHSGFLGAPATVPACVPSTRPPALHDHPQPMGVSPSVVAWRARYAIERSKEKGGLCRCTCIEPGWEAIHSRGKEVWIPWVKVARECLGAVKRGAEAPGQRLVGELGFVLQNGEAACLRLVLFSSC